MEYLLSLYFVQTIGDEYFGNSLYCHVIGLRYGIYQTIGLYVAMLGLQLFVLTAYCLVLVNALSLMLGQ